MTFTEVDSRPVFMCGVVLQHNVDIIIQLFSLSRFPDTRWNFYLQGVHLKMDYQLHLLT